MAKIAVTVGHGEGDPGAVSGGHKEHDLAGIIARSMAAHLRHRGQAILYHRGVKDIPSRIRVLANIINHAQCDLAVQIHLNAFRTDDAHGSECWIYAPGGKRAIWASKMAGAMSKFFKDRGVKDKHYTFVKATRMPAVIVEAGFITNKHDRNLVLNKGQAIGKALADATLEYLGVPEPKPKPMPTKRFYRIFEGNNQVGAYELLPNALRAAGVVLERGNSVRIVIVKEVT